MMFFGSLLHPPRREARAEGIAPEHGQPVAQRSRKQNDEGEDQERKHLVHHPLDRPQPAPAGAVIQSHQERHPQQDFGEPGFL